MKKYFLIILGLVLVIGVSTYLLNKNQVYTVHPTRGDITEAVYGLGKVKSRHRFEVILGVISTIRKVFVEEGDEVKRGQPLMNFDQGGVFVSPFHGTVTLVKSKESEVALVNVPLLRVEDLNSLYVELSLEQQAALRVQKGQRAKVSFESLRNKIYEGKVVAIFPREDEFLAHIEVGKLEPGVLPGMTADVSIEIGELKNVLLIPLKAVTNGMVFVKRKSRWVKQKVEIGHVDASQVEVLGELLQESDELRISKE